MKIKKILSLLLCALCAISLFACGKEPEETGDTSGTVTEQSTESQMSGETETESGGSGIGPETDTEKEDYSVSNYFDYYSDGTAAKNWLENNILNSTTPPVDFTVDGKSAKELSWTKTDKGEMTVVDYADTDDPVSRTERKIVYTCADAGLEITLTLTGYPDYPVVEYDAVMKNISSENSGEITKVFSVNSVLCNEKTVLHYTKGTTIKEDDYEPHTEELKANAFHLETNLGQPCEAYLPYFNFECGEGGVIAAINWQGDWTADMFTKDGGTVLKAGQYNCDFALFADEEYRFPGTVLLFYRNGGWQEGQNIWRRWIIRHNFMRYTGGRDYKHNIFACSDIVKTSSDIAAIKEIAAAKISDKYNITFEIDAGWYETNGQDWTKVGNWTPNSKYGADGLKKVSDACHEAGIKFCLWMEPERLFYGTPLADELGEDCIFLYNTGKYVAYNRYSTGTCMPWGVVNYGSQKTVDTLVALVDKVIKTYGVDIYRQDFNTHYYQFWKEVDLYYSKRLDVPRYGMTENHACTGYLEFLHRLFELNPGVLFDACASGGRRYDLETMRFGFMHTKSDYVELATEGMAQVIAQNQNLSTSSWYIITGTGLGAANDKYDVRSRLCLDVSFSARYAKNQSQALKWWSDMTKYAYNDYYALTEFNLDKNAVAAMQFNDPDKGEGMAVIYLRSGGEYTCKLMGLENKAVYQVWDIDKKNDVTEMTGAELMNSGYTVSSKAGTPAAVIINYKKAD